MFIKHIIKKSLNETEVDYNKRYTRIIINNDNRLKSKCLKN